MEKVYLALVHGHFASAGRPHYLAHCSRPGQPHSHDNQVGDTGRSALTEYKTLETFDELSYLEVRIGTGRTHQIRVHLASLRHPIYGDTIYGAPAASLGRFFLHAHRLSFDSPSTGERITVESPLAPELAALLETLRHNTVNMDVLK